MKYTVTVLAPVAKALEKIRDRNVRERLTQAIDELADTPRPHGCKKLVGFENLYRIRRGNWRISYAIEDDQLIVLIVEVEQRGNAYKDL